MWVVVPMTYEKWVNPSNKNDKHYRAVFRSTTGRRVGKRKFKRASEALAVAKFFHLRLCKRREVDAVRGQGNNRDGHQLLPG